MLLEEATDLVSNATHCVGHVARDVRHATGDVARDMRHAAGDAARDVRHATGDVARDVLHAAGDGRKFFGVHDAMLKGNATSDGPLPELMV